MTLFFLIIFIANAIADAMFITISLNSKSKAELPKWFIAKSALFAGFSAIVSILVFGNIYLR